MDLPELMTAQEVSEWLRIGGVQAVYDLIRSQGMPAYRVGKHWRFRQQDIEDWMREQAQAMIPPSHAPGMASQRPSASRRTPVDIDAELKRLMG